MNAALSGVPLLALLESRALDAAAVKPLVQDRDPGTSEIAATGWPRRTATRSSTFLRAGRLRRLGDGEAHPGHQAGDGALHARWL